MSKIDALMSEGLQLHQSGRLAEAERLYLKVLDKHPSHAAANHLSGLVLLQRGDAAGAVSRLQRAVHVRSQDPEYLANLGTALNAAGRPAEAVEAFDKALALQPRNPAALNNKGMALKALGRHDEAAAAYRAAIALLPEAGFFRNLGTTLTELGDWHGAEAAYRQALAHRDNFPNALTGLCYALQALDRKNEAVSAAAAHAARYPAEAEYHRALGHANWLAGKPEAAAAAYRAAIAAKPDDAEAHRLLALIVPRRTEDEEVEAIEALLARTDLKDDQRAQLEFALGTTLDDIGDHERSFQHLSRGNAIVRRLRPFDLAAARAEMDALREAYAALPESEVPELAPADGPVFIVGLPRSGKTSLEGMLARHPAFFPGGELPVAGNVAAALRKDGRTALRGPAARELGRRYAAMAETLASGRRLLDTMPNNFLLVGALRLALPNARVIHCTRPPAEHAAVLFRKYFSQSGNEYTSDMSDLAGYIDLYRELMSFWSQRFPGFVVDLETSSLQDIAVAAMRDILAFLAADWEPRCAIPYQSEPRSL